MAICCAGSSEPSDSIKLRTALVIAVGSSRTGLLGIILLTCMTNIFYVKNMGTASFHYIEIRRKLNEGRALYFTSKFLNYFPVCMNTF